MTATSSSVRSRSRRSISRHRGTLRHRRRLLYLPDWVAAQARQPARDARRRPRSEGRAVLDEALARRRRRSGDWADLEFRVVGSVPSVDMPGHTHYSTTPDNSQVPDPLTVQIPIVAPVRTRLVEFGRSGTGDSRGRTASARRIVRRTCRSPGRSRSTARMRTP